MAARENPHGEANLSPANYAFVGWFDNHPDFGFDAATNPEIWKAELERLREQREELIRRSTSAFGKVGQCAHCGNHIRYHVLIEDLRDGALLAIGEDCADNRFALSPREWATRKAELDAMQERARAGEKRIKLRAQYPEAVEILEAALKARAQLHEDLMAIADEDQAQSEERGEYGCWNAEQHAAYHNAWPAFIRDVAGRMVHYGDLSERQAAAVVKVYAEHTRRLRERAAEKEAAQPVPTGNSIELEGEVVSIKIHESMYGDTLKMVVKGDDGWRVWGTVPRTIDEATWNSSDSSLKGSRVKFTANVERSKDDESFGFFKRPRKAEVLAAANTK